MQSLNRLGPSQLVDAWPSYGNIGSKCLFQEHYNALPISRTKPRVNNLVVVNLHSYPLSCTVTSWDNSFKCCSQGHNSVEKALFLRLKIIACYVFLSVVKD